MRRVFLSAIACIVMLPIAALPTSRSARAAVSGGHGEGTHAPLLLLRYPTMSKTRIAFEYGGEIWEMPRSGGQAHVLASGMDMLTKPIFSPNGKMVAFSGTYDDNTDVYVVPADGGQPRRLTYHPGPDIAVGWTPDGRSVLFRSRRYSFSDPNQLYTVPVTGAFPKALPLPEAEEGAYSPDGSHLAYVPGFQWESFWKDYKGGQHTQVWLARLSDSHVVRIPDKNANERDPMWVGNTVYFLSDRDGPITLFAYDTTTGKVHKLIDNTGFDITSASAGPGGIVYSQFGQLHIYDFATGRTHAVHAVVRGDLPQRRPRFEKVGKNIVSATISPHGVRAAFEALGDILSVPTKHGSMVNLTHSPGAMDRDPAWSPDGKSLAYFSDCDGEYDLYVRDQNGTGNARRVKLGQDGAFYYGLSWSPDSRKLVFGDQKLDLWYVNLASAHPHPIRVARNDHAVLQQFRPGWSPDSRWIAYAKVMPNQLHAIFIYSLADNSTHQVTDAGSDCRYPVFDANGKYLYFTSSTNTALTSGMWEMTGMDRPVTRHVYAVTLEPGTASPVAPRPGFDKPGAKHKHHAEHAGNAHKPPPQVRIDFKGLLARAVPLPIKAANYVGLSAGKTGQIYLQKAKQALLDPEEIGPVSIISFDLGTRKSKTVIKGITRFELAADGKKMLYHKGKDWFIADARHGAKPKSLDTASLKVFVEPAREWAQMYRDAWRMQRAFFYNPNYDGLDVKAAEKEFAHYLPGIASRDGLTFLFREMMSYMSVGHMFVEGGYRPTMQQIHVGLLGANYAVEHGRYRITRIFTGGTWNPDAYAPLAQPGLKVRTGDYLLAVNGTPIHGNQNIYKAFQDLAKVDVTLTVGPNPDMRGSHQITVKTIPSESKLRHIAWIDHNMALVDKLSHGQLGYVYLPDTANGGYRNFNRYFFSQVDRKGVIIDERFNHGGDISDYIIQYLQRRPMAMIVTRWIPPRVAPTMAIYGPKVMLINQFSGSGGDALPWYFRKAGLGTLVGERTWGGLVGIGGYPRLMDGGAITSPRVAFEGLDGTFPVENHGVAPDVTVWQDPALVRKGQDPQLQRGIDIALKQLKAHPQPHYTRPPWRNYHPKLPPLPGGTQ